MQPVGDFLGQRGIGIAGDQLDRAVLGRHRRFSSRLAGYDVQHIEKSSGNRRVSMGEEISGRGLGWQPVAAGFPGQKWAVTGLYWAALLGAEAKRGDAGRILGGYGASALATAGPRRAGAGAGAASGVPLIMPVRPLRPACAIFRSTRSSAAAQASRPALPAGFFAGKPQRALLVVVVDVPDPGDHGLCRAPPAPRDSCARDRKRRPRGRRSTGCAASIRCRAR